MQYYNNYLYTYILLGNDLTLFRVKPDQSDYFQYNIYNTKNILSLLVANDLLYISTGHEIYIYNTTENEPKYTIQNILGISISVVENFLYILSEQGLEKYDTEYFKLHNVYSLYPNNEAHVYITPHNKKIITMTDSGKLNLIDPPNDKLTYAVIRIYKNDINTYSFCLSNDFLYVASYYDDESIVITKHSFDNVLKLLNIYKINCTGIESITSTDDGIVFFCKKYIYKISDDKVYRLKYKKTPKKITYHDNKIYVLNLDITFINYNSDKFKIVDSYVPDDEDFSILNYDSDKLSDYEKFEEDIYSYESYESDIESVSSDYDYTNINNCTNDNSLTLEKYTNDDEPFMIYTLNSQMKFEKALCTSMDEWSSYIQSDLNNLENSDEIDRIPMNIMCLSQPPDDGDASGVGSIPTRDIVIKTPNQLFITLGSAIRIKTEYNINKLWYALPMFNGKRRRVSNIKGIIGSSMNHGQIPGFKIFKLYRRDELYSTVQVSDKGDFPRFTDNDNITDKDIIHICNIIM